MKLSLKKKPKIGLIIPDTHRPYHDKRAYNLMLKIAKDLPKVDELVVLGDFADFYSVSNYAKDPKVSTQLLDEIEDVRRGLRELEYLFPKANKVYIEGNHEFRLQKFIRDKAPELFGCFDCQSIFGLKECNWKWVPYTPDQSHHILNSRLIARHEPSGNGKYSAGTTVERCGASVVFGHTHRIQEFQTVMLDGKNHRGVNLGWLGKQDHSAFQYVKNHHQWAHCFGVVYVVDKRFFLQTVHIIDYMTVFNGRLYKG